MAYEEVIIGLIALLVVLLVIVLFRQSRVGPGAQDRKLGDLDKTLAVLAQQVKALEDNVRGLQPTVNEIHKRAAVLDERTRMLPEMNKLTVQVEDRTRVLPETKEKLGTIDTKMDRVKVIDAKLDDLQGIFRSSTARGRAGEEAVLALMSSLPQDMWDSQVSIGGGRVDFVTYMPNGFLLSIDSKTGGSDQAKEVFALMDQMDATTGDQDRAQLQAQVNDAVGALARKIETQASKIGEYLKHEPRSLPVAVEAVPDPMFDLLPINVRHACSELNIEVVPYTLLLPFIGSMRRLNQYSKSNVERIVASLVKVRGLLTDFESIVDDRVAKANAMLTNAVPDLRDRLAKIQTELATVQPDEATSGAVEPPTDGV